MKLIISVLTFFKRYLSLFQKEHLTLSDNAYGNL
jgi:hypothetical protein